MNNACSGLCALRALVVVLFVFMGGLTFDARVNESNEWLMQLQNPDKQYGRKAVEKRRDYKTNPISEKQVKAINARELQSPSRTREN